MSLDRRQFNSIPLPLVTALMLWTHQRAYSLSPGGLSSAEASQGLKTALEKGAIAAVKRLVMVDGFLGNSKVRIPLPGYLESVPKLIKALGQGRRVDRLVTAMNRAAEIAEPMAKGLLVNAVNSVTVTDAKQILTKVDTCVTTFFADKTLDPLGLRFLPVVTQATAKVGPAAKYNQVADKAAGNALLRKVFGTLK